MRSEETLTPTKNSHSRRSISFRLVAGLVARTPDRLLYYASRIGGAVQFGLAAGKRRNYLANTSGVVTFGGRRQPWHAFQNHALNVLELLKCVSEDKGAIERRLTLEGGDHIDLALARGNGLILTTFHLGNWELGGLLLAQRGYPITTIAGEQLRRGWSDEVKSLKRRFGIKVVSPDGSMRELYRDLRANRVVVLHIDGDLFAGGHYVSFLGKRIAVPRGPAHLSRVLGAPTALAYCRRTDRHKLRVCIEPLENPPQRREDEYALTCRFMERVEKCILEAPEQWCIFRRLSP